MPEAARSAAFRQLFGTPRFAPALTPLLHAREPTTSPSTVASSFKESNMGAYTETETESRAESSVQPMVGQETYDAMVGEIKRLRNELDESQAKRFEAEREQTRLHEKLEQAIRGRRIAQDHFHTTKHQQAPQKVCFYPPAPPSSALSKAKEAELAQLVSDKARLERELVEARTQVGKLTRERDGEKAGVKILSKELDVSKGKIEEAESAAEGLGRKVDRMYVELEKAKKERNAAKAEAEKAEKELEEAKKMEIKKTGEAQASFGWELEAAREGLKRVQEENKELIRRLAHVEKAGNTTRTSAVSAASPSTVKTLTKSVKDMNDKIRQLEQQNTELLLELARVVEGK